MFLIVDKNEQATNPSIVKQLQSCFTNVMLGNLIAGDINIPLDSGDVLAIERKAPHDFLASIADGRIFEQVESMAQNAKYSAFIVTGYFLYKDKSDIVVIDGEETNWKGAAVRATMNLIQYSGCALIFCPVNRYGETIAELYNTVNKPDERQSVRKKRIITFPPVDERVEFFAQLPGVGFKKAESFMKWVKKMEPKATPKDDDYGKLSSALHWLSILSGIDKKERPAGWGPMLILNTRKFLGLESDEYLAAIKELEHNDKEPAAIEMDGNRWEKYSNHKEKS